MTNITEVTNTLKANRKAMISLLETDYDGRKLSLEEKEARCKNLSRVLINQLQINPEVLKASPDSIYLAAMEGVRNKLELGYDFHLVAYGNVCKCMMDYKGKLTLAKRSKRVTKIDVQLVHENDEFWLRFGEEPYHKISGKSAFNRGEIIGVYAVGKELDARGIEQVYVDPMSVDEINDIRNRYSQQKNGTAWTNSWGEMAKKTVLRRLTKRLDRSINDQFRLTSNQDMWHEDTTFDNAEVIEGKTVQAPAMIEQQINPTDQLNAAFDAKEKEPVKAKSKKKDEVEIPTTISEEEQLEKEEASTINSDLHQIEICCNYGESRNKQTFT